MTPKEGEFNALCKTRYKLFVLKYTFKTKIFYFSEFTISCGCIILRLCQVILKRDIKGFHLE